MDRLFPLNQLDVIGCKEVPASDPAMPRLLSAIFAVRNSDRVLFPPYTLGEQEVIGPVLSTREEFDDLVASEEASLHNAGQAQPGHELWLNDDGMIHYTPDYIARRKLSVIFESRCGLAKKALKSGSLSEARTHAMVAYSANPKSVQALCFRAAAEHLMTFRHPEREHVRVELALTEMIAKSHLPIPAFRKLYIEMAEGNEVEMAVKVAPTSRNVGGSKLSGITKWKPAQVKNDSRELCFA